MHYDTSVRFIYRAEGSPARLGILAGSFNPPTRAHLALLEAAAAGEVDEVLCVIPRVFPHKIYHGASLDDRLAMLEAARPAAPCSIAVSEGGLFTDIARECRDAYAGAPDLLFLCGRDAAERIVYWDYGDASAIDRMFEHFSLLVAARQGRFEPPVHLAHRVRNLEVPGDLDEISSTEVRERIRNGEPWEHLVPAGIVDHVRRIYR